MGLTDKFRNSAQSFRGRLKESTGRATGNRFLKRKGRREQAGGDLKQVGEKTKDVFRR
ncbi:CsbD family protein [Streptomyces sp. NPDC006530]|uniref:CsbD family protein n=1 Tax=Streptomyces sp. NPDC006530 TaxID=3364750 RepID=UPI0036B5D824